MRNFLRYIVVFLTVSILAFTGSASAVQRSAAATDTTRVAQANIEAQSKALSLSDSEKRAQRSFFSSIRNFLPFRFANNNAIDNGKLLSNVKVFPNPIVDQISLSYRLSKQSSVSIKVMDA